MDPTKGDTQPRPGAEAPKKPQAGGKRPNEEEILDVISGVQSQLESLRKAHAERQKALAALASQRQELESERGNLDEKRAEIDRALGDVNLGKEKIRSQEEKLRQREQELSKREARITAAAEHVSEYEQNAPRRVEELEQEAKRASTLRDELEEVRRISRERQDQINTLEERLSSGMSGENARQSEAQARVDALRAEIESIKASASQHEEAAASLRQEIETLRASGQSESADRDGAAQQLGQLRDELSEMVKRAQVAEQRAEAGKSALEDQRAEFERRVKKVQGEAAGASDESAKLRFKISEFERELAEAKRGRDEERRAREESEEKLKNAPTPGKGKRVQEITTLRKENAGLRAKLLSKGSPGGREKVEQLGGALKESKERIASLEGELESVRRQLDEAGDQAELAKSLEAARTHTQELEASVASLNEQLKAAQKASGEGLDPGAALRRERLRKQRRLTREQSVKVRRASEALRERFSQCEVILSKRAQLAEAHQAIAEKEAKLVHKHAKSGSMWLVLGMATLFGILAGVSWLIAGRAAPGMYAARAVVVADGGARTLTPDNLDAWQLYHEDLTRDPRLIETVAERLKRRGLKTLSTPGELTKVLETGLETQSPHAGRLELEFRGLGATHTQRVLDTYVVAMTSVANANRVRRADGASTRVEVEATPYPEPLDQTRLIYAGGIMGGGVLFSLVMGFGAYRKLANAKARFEHDHRVDVLAGDVQWGAPGEQDGAGPDST